MFVFIFGIDFKVEPHKIFVEGPHVRACDTITVSVLHMN